MSALKIDEATKRALAVKASCDPRTIAKLVRGVPVRGMAGHRAREVLREAGLLPPEHATVESDAGAETGRAA